MCVCAVGSPVGGLWVGGAFAQPNARSLRKAMTNVNQFDVWAALIGIDWLENGECESGVCVCMYIERDCVFVCSP